MRNSTRPFFLTLLIGAVLSCPGLAPGQDDSQTKKEPTYRKQAPIRILCGTSFRAPMEEIVKQYEKASGSSASLVFGGSEDHLPKVKLKATGDVYVTHTPYMRYTKEADALLRDVRVGFLAPVLVTENLAATGIFSGFRLIRVPAGEEAAANAVRVNGTVLVADGNPETADILTRNGYDVTPVPTAQAAMLDGGLSCMSLRFQAEKPA